MDNNNGQLGSIRQIAGTNLNIYVSNLNYNQLKENEYKDKLPVNCLVICAENVGSTDLSYRIAAIDSFGSMCPLVPFDTIEKGGLEVKQSAFEVKLSNSSTVVNRDVLQVKCGNGLKIDENGFLTLDIDPKCFKFNDKGQLTVGRVDGIAAEVITV